MKRTLVMRAALFAQRAHCGQVRKWTGTPYIWHPMRVAGRLMLQGAADHRLIAIAWLHDVIEDTGVTDEQLKQEFGRSVGLGVWHLTNPSKHRTDLTRPERKAIDREHLKDAPAWAKNIKLLDRIDNLREMFGAESDFIVMYKEESRLLLEVLRGTNEDLERELESLLV